MKAFRSTSLPAAGLLSVTGVAGKTGRARVRAAILDGENP